MDTGTFRGSGFSTLSSGKTTSVAHVLSVVRRKVRVAFDPAGPFGTEIEPGENPCSSATIRASPVAEAIIVEPFEGSGLASDCREQAAIRTPRPTTHAAQATRLRTRSDLAWAHSPSFRILSGSTFPSQVQPPQ